MTLYELEVKDSSDALATFTPVTYDGTSPQVTLDVLVDTFLVPGTVYDIRFRAKNLIGYGEYSDYLRRAFNALPIAPTNLRRVEIMCTKT